MQTAFITHHACLEHDTGPTHPESAARLRAISDHLIANRLFDLLLERDAPEVTRGQLERVHDLHYLDRIEAEFDQVMPRGQAWLDPDTPIGPGSPEAARRAAGALILAVDMVLGGEVENAFCAVRPPGHHAERDRAMGFCIYNNVAVGAAHALEAQGLERVAIVDFDVHHGNGTEQIFRDDPRVLLCSSFQHPFYPYTGCAADQPNLVCSPLHAGAGGSEFRALVERQWLPALERFRPEMIFISAGFDGHAADDMAGLRLVEADYQWVTEQLMGVARRHARSRIVSTLEGGYELHALARSVETHLRVLMGLHN